MANVLQAEISGVLVGFVARPYKGFTTGDGTSVAGGVTHLVWISSNPDAEPEAIKCNPESFGALRGLGFGERVKAEVTYRPARDGRSFQTTLDAFEREAPTGGCGHERAATAGEGVGGLKLGLGEAPRCPTFSDRCADDDRRSGCHVACNGLGRAVGRWCSPGRGPGVCVFRPARAAGAVGAVGGGLSGGRHLCGVGRRADDGVCGWGLRVGLWPEGRSH